MSVMGTVGKIGSAVAAGLNAITNPLGALAPLLGGALGASGAQDINRQNIAWGREQQRWQEKMAGTAYQRASADMKAAGINPMVMFGHGNAAQTPSAISAPQLENAPAHVGQGIQSTARWALERKSLQLGLERAAIENDNARRQGLFIDSQTRRQLAETDLAIRDLRLRDDLAGQYQSSARASRAQAAQLERGLPYTETRSELAERLRDASRLPGAAIGAAGAWWEAYRARERERDNRDIFRLRQFGRNFSSGIRDRLYRTSSRD